MRSPLATLPRLLLLALMAAGVAMTLLEVRSARATEGDGAAWQRPETAVDVTLRFRSFVVDGQLSEPAVNAAFARVRGRLQGVRVIIAPSFLVDLISPAVGLGVLDYFSDQRRWLESAGIATELAPVDTEASVASNGAAIARRIRTSDKPLCILSHSKGGLDTLAGLATLTTEELERVRCWIALQAPFAGTPIADMAAQLWMRSVVIDPALLLYGGSPGSLDDLTTELRRRDLAAADRAIQRVVQAVPTLAVTTVLPPAQRPRSGSFFAPTHAVLIERGIENDGIVPTASAILPHARFVVLDGLDHGDTVDLDCLPDCGVGSDVLLLKALLAIALEQP